MNSFQGLLVCALVGFATACGPSVDQGTHPQAADAAVDTTPTAEDAPQCPPGQMFCGDSCTNLRTDADNCGACSTRCAPGATCRAGACQGGTPTPVPTCASGTANCDRNDANGCETNTATDPTNCGICGARCAAGYLCSSGRCTPAPSTIRCGDGVCSAGSETCATCAADCGVCAPVCGAGAGNCDGNNANGCETNTTNDTHNCGRCGASCAPGQTCSSGSCITPPTSCVGSWTNCSGFCRDLTSDNLNCGACGRPCAGPATCRGGSCIAPTPTCTGTGYAVCSGVCTNLLMDNTNCGACGANCAAARWVCSGGLCVDPRPTCTGPGQMYCSGRCVDAYTDATNCGACGAVCGSGRACAMGVCTAMATGLETFRVWYRTPVTTTVQAANLYQFSDSSVGYLQAMCSLAGGEAGAFMGHSCNLVAHASTGILDVNTQVQLSPAETARMGGRTTTWCAATYSSGGPVVMYGDMGVEWYDRSQVLVPVRNGVDGYNLRATLLR